MMKAFIKEKNKFSCYEPKQASTKKRLAYIYLNVLFQKQLVVNFPLQAAIYCYN